MFSIMEHCKKLSSWDIYGVKKFPYRGKRKYSPGVTRSFNGIITITNDVFGLTILQFEREFKACVTRRKQNKQRILNIRFPNKVSNSYIDYLKYEDNIHEEYMPYTDHQCTKTTLFEDQMHRCLIQVAGTELEIRTRQRMFQVRDKINNMASDVFRYISSGSLAEGIDLAGSDVDIMMELDGVTVIDDLKYLYSSTGRTTLLMEYDERYPGFCKLKVAAAKCCHTNKFTKSFTETDRGIYISTEKIIQLLFDTFNCTKQCRHGPCLSDPEQNVDKAFCLRSRIWPNDAKEWKLRHRVGLWPTGNIIDTVVNDGCLFVPIGPKNECDVLFWRISFSLAEKRLIHSMNYTQLMCYVLLKLTLKNIINRNEDAKDLLCSYFLKTTVFWVSEEICIDTFTITNLSYCFFLCIDKLMLFIMNCYCPNYFIPRHNMFIGKVDKSNNKILLSILGFLRNAELKLIVDQVFGNNISSVSLCTENYKKSVCLDFLFYRVLNIRVNDIGRAYKTLHTISTLMESESSEFVLDVLKYYHAVLSQCISQWLVLHDHRRERFKIIRRFNKHLIDGTKSDAVSGWLLYASFYYVRREFKTSLHIVSNMLSRCTPEMTLLAKNVYTTEDVEKYKRKIEGHWTLNHRMEKATLAEVLFIRQSTLIPPELRLEVQDNHMFVPPIVLCRVLQFLCFHHLCSFKNQKRALDELNSKVNESFLMEDANSSQLLVILGVCLEISGDKTAAFDCYNKALHFGHHQSYSTKRRIENLFRH